MSTRKTASAESRFDDCSFPAPSSVSFWKETRKLLHIPVISFQDSSFSVCQDLKKARVKTKAEKSAEDLC